MAKKQRLAIVRFFEDDCFPAESEDDIYNGKETVRSREWKQESNAAHDPGGAGVVSHEVVVDGWQFERAKVISLRSSSRSLEADVVQRLASPDVRPQQSSSRTSRLRR